MPKLFHTGDGSEDAVSFVSLQIVTPNWFRQSLITAIGLMCNEENWSEDGDASTDFARDKSVEMLNSLTTDVPMSNYVLAEIKIFASRSEIPAGFLECAGQNLLRADYPDLFAAIGTMYGSTSGDQFNLPDLRRSFPAGAAFPPVPGGDMNLGDTGGEEEHTLLTAEMPVHDHNLRPDGNGTSLINIAASGGYTYASGSLAAGPVTSTGEAGSGDAHENRPPFLALVFAIYTGVE